MDKVIVITETEGDYDLVGTVYSSFLALYKHIEPIMGPYFEATGESLVDMGYVTIMVTDIIE